MPEVTLTPAQVAEAITANPEIQKAAIETLTKSNYAIRDQAAQTAYEADLRKQEADRVASGIHTQYDKDLAELFGEDYKRNQGEHTYEAMKRIGKAKIQAYTTKVSELEAAIAKGDHSGALKKQLEEVQATFQRRVEELTNENTTLKTGAENGSKQIALQSAYSEISKNFLKTLPPMFDRTKKSIFDDILKDVIVKDGVAYKGKNGVIDRDPVTLKDYALVDYLKLEFKDVIDTKKPAGGSGSGGPGNGDPGLDPANITENNFIRAENVKSTEDLMTQMMALGIPKGTKEFNAIWNKHVDTKQNKLKPVVA